MVSLRTVVAAPTILLCGLVDAPAQATPENALKPEAEPMLLALHFYPFLILEEGALHDARVTRVDVVDVGKERRRCHVVEGMIRPAVPSADPKKSPTIATPGVDWLVSMIRLQGLAEDGGRTLYSPWPSDERAVSMGEPTRVTLWIDENAHIVLRSKLSAQLYKRTARSAEQPVEKLTVTVTESFTIAAVNAPPAGLFRFTPPEGAKEVSNVSSRRTKK